MTSTRVARICGLYSALFAPAVASAQQPNIEPPAAPRPATSANEASAGKKAAPPSDHQRAVGRVGVSWLGVSEIPVGTDGNAAVAPALGVRYWFTPLVGLDVGVGISWSTSSAETEFAGEVTTNDGPSTIGFLGHVGVPLALYHQSHYAFTVVPELNVGYAVLTVPTGEGTETVDRGLRVDFGGRLGAEIHFGFIGIPSLSLEASVGVFLQHLIGIRELKQEDTTTRKTTESSTAIATTVTNDPWDIFRTSVAARYYF